MDTQTREAIKFFAANAGYSDPPGRLVCALALAKAEREARCLNLQAAWEDNYDSDTSWMDTEQCADFDAGKLASFRLRIFNADNSEVLAALSGICLYVDKDNTDERRVYEAECFQEAIAELERGKAAHCEECGAVDL